MLNSIALRCYMLHFYFLCFVVKHFVIIMCAFSKPLGDTQTQSPDESTDCHMMIGRSPPHREVYRLHERACVWGGGGRLTEEDRKGGRGVVRGGVSRRQKD